MSTLLTGRKPQEQPLDAWLTGYINEINKLLKARNFGIVSDVMGSLNPTQLDNEASLALLRVTAPVKPFVRNWDAFCDRVRAHFDATHLRTERLLRGL